MEYRWISPDTVPANELISKYHPAIASALAHRNITSIDDANIFLYPDYARDSHDPFLFDDMNTALERIARAIEAEEQVIIYCDYDVDGLSSGAILYTTLQKLGCAVRAYMNHREKDGYGLQRDAISRLIDEGATLFITTDCGISNAAEISFAGSRGVDVIITDHHTVPALPEDIPAALAIIHPLVRAQNYPWKFLSGGGSAFKLAQALIRTSHESLVRRREAACDDSGKPIHWEAFEKWLLDFVCLSTIGDCVTLQGENRAFVHYGLRVLAKTRRRGIRALISRIQKRNQQEITSRMISFFIAPRINAASRMDHARIAFELLTTESEAEAEQIADTLERLNTERQKLTEKLVSAARHQLDPIHAEQKKVLVGSGDQWPLGILGLVAGKLCDYYRKPVVLMTNGNGCISGAARSTDAFHITNAFSQVSHHFERYGGHACAGGFALKKESSINDVRESLELLGEQIPHFASDEGREIRIDAEISIADISWELLGILQRFEPHGVGNPKPRFLIVSASLDALRHLGQTGNHIRIDISQDSHRTQCIGFSFAHKLKGIAIGDSIDIVCELDEHEWMNQKSIQLTLIDIRLSNTSV